MTKETRFFNDLIPISINLGGSAYDLLVRADYQPAEYDTNTAESVDICSAVEEDNCILSELSESDIKEIECDVLQKFQAYCELFSCCFS